MPEKRILARIEKEKGFTAYPMTKINGDKIWHGVYDNRSAFPLPAMSVGPIRSREVRKKKGLKGYP
jgi:hypothetical protein